MTLEVAYSSPTRKSGPAPHVTLCTTLAQNDEWIAQQDEAIIIDNDNRSFFPSLALRPDNVAIAFYSAPYRAAASYDFEYGWGAFEAISFHWPPDSSMFVFEPKGCVDSVGNIYLSGMVGLENDFPCFAGVVWFALRRAFEDWEVGAPVVFDTVTIPSQLMTSSKEFDRTALIWHKNLVGFPVPERWENFGGAVQMNNDIYVAVISDSGNWDFENAVNITKTIFPRPILVGEGAYGDTLRPYPDLDAIWVDDVLHVVFTARGFWADPDGRGEPPVERISAAETFIWHWDSESDTLTLVADGWYENDFISGYNSGNVSKPSLGADSDGILYCVFRQTFPEDHWGEYCAGDIMVARSSDGIEWSSSIDLTDSHPDGDQIAPWNEINPSLAEKVDDALHISYLKGWTGGDDPEENRREMEVVYHRVPVADLPDFGRLELPRDDFQYHNREALLVMEELASPSGFAMLNAYPNPFNNKTRVSFNLDCEQSVRLEARDLQGRTVAILFAGKGSSGENRVVWDAASVPSGVYLIRLEGETHAAGLKVALVR